MIVLRIVAALLLCAGMTRGAAAQAADTTSTVGVPRVGPPIRQITTAAALSKERIGSIASVRELADGRVLVNDGASRRLLLLDTMLVLDRVVLDSLSDRENTYGTEPGILVAHRGDSSLFLDRVSLAMLVIGPSGELARVRSMPRDLYRYSRSVHAMTDARGRFILQMRARPAPPAQPLPRGVAWVPTEPDSAFIVALDMDTRGLDTVAVVRVPKVEYMVRARPGGWGGTSWTRSTNPLPSQDVWTVLPDGGIAIVRALDYRVEYLNGDGTQTSSGKIPYEWEPVPDAEKRRLVDSVETELMRRARFTYTTSVIRFVNTYGKDYPPNFSAPEGYVPPNGFLRDWRFPPGVEFSERYIHGCPPGVEATIEPGAGEPSGGIPDDDEVRPGPPPQGRPSCIPQPVPNLARVPDPPRIREVSVVSTSAIPDFRPPFDDDAVRADLDGNLWVETNAARRRGGGPIYDIIDRQGELVDRLQVPRAYSLVGFGRGRVVFLSMRDAQGIHLARVRLR